jgi:hypothetical protein
MIGGTVALWALDNHVKETVFHLLNVLPDNAGAVKPLCARDRDDRVVGPRRHRTANLLAGDGTVTSFGVQPALGLTAHLHLRPHQAVGLVTREPGYGSG